MIVSTRPEASADESFVRRLVLDTVARDLGAAFWPEAVRAPLLEMQYASRRRSIRSQYPHATSRVVSIDGRDAGWLVVAEAEDEIRLVEIMIGAEYRRRGIASSLARDLITHARKPVRLSVSASNDGALRLYERLGFRRTGGDELIHRMEYP